jgi:hypothetical protein
MAEIIPITSRARAARLAPKPAEGAQILFFLGVRYMRVEEPPTVRGGAPGARGEAGGGKGRRRRARA